MTTVTKGAEFENQVADLYRLMGYKVQQNVELFGHQVDILLTYIMPGGIMSKIVVECKYLEKKNLSFSYYKTNLASLINLRDNEEIQNIVIITTHGFSSKIWANAEANRIQLLTIRDLHHQTPEFRKDYVEYPENSYLSYFSIRDFIFLLKKYIERGHETAYIEFKREVPPPRVLSAIICAMANTESGIIVFGVDLNAFGENKDPWIGIEDTNRLKERILLIVRDYLAPMVSLKLIPLNIGVKECLIAVIPKQKDPIFSSGRYYVRREDTSEYLRSWTDLMEQQKKKETINKFGFLVFEKLKRDLSDFRLEEKKSLSFNSTYEVESVKEITWKIEKGLGYIQKSLPDHKKDLHSIWDQIKKGEDWARLEEFAFLLVSHLSDRLIVRFLSNISIHGNQTDSIIFLNEPTWGDVLIEAKNRKKSSPRDVDQIFTRMYELNIKIGFLLTKSRLTGRKGQLEAIQLKNLKGDIIIVPLQGSHIQEFFSSEESTQDFLLRMIHLAKYKTLDLLILK